MHLFRPAGMNIWLQSIRWYSPRTLMDITSFRLKERAKQLQLSEARPKTFKPALAHFRLTRFGWQHRKSGSEGERKRFRGRKATLLGRAIAYVNPRDYKTMRIYFPHVNFASRQSPVDTNINNSSVRRLLPSHIG